MPVDRIGYVHVLAHTIEGLGSAEWARENLRMLVIEPCRYRVGWGSENDLDACLAHGIHDAIHPRVLKLSILWFPQAPGGLTHANDVQARLFHQADVVIEPFVWLVLVVIGRSVKDRWKIKSGG